MLDDTLTTKCFLMSSRIITEHSYLLQTNKAICTTWNCVIMISGISDSNIDMQVTKRNKSSWEQRQPARDNQPVAATVLLGELSFTQLSHLQPRIKL